MASTLTCIACSLMFEETDDMKNHYKTDFHRLNVKRKVAELPPLSEEDFKKREAVFLASQGKGSALFSAECKICHKKLASDGAYKQHLDSNLHKKTLARLEARGSRPATVEETVVVKRAEEVELEQKQRQEAVKAAQEQAKQAKQQAETAEPKEGDDDEESDGDFVDSEPIPPTDCLFCGLGSESMAHNLHHMTKVHGFFIPDLEYLSDPEGLAVYLGEKVGIGHVCLVCNDRGRSFRSVDAVQKHMVSKSHCKLNYDSYQEELAPFYDFSSSYTDDSSALVLQRKARVHAQRVKKLDGGEDEGSDEEIFVDSPVEVASGGFELILPDGTRAGHRSLHKYYKQKVPAVDERRQMLVGRLLLEYKSMGWQTKELATTEKLLFKRNTREQSKHWLKMGMHTNGLWKHMHISTADC